MPIFEYTCLDCSHKFEILTYSNKEETVSCEHCGSARVNKEFSVFSVASNTTSISNSCADSCASAGICPSAGMQYGDGSCGCPGMCNH